MAVDILPGKCQILISIIILSEAIEIKEKMKLNGFTCDNVNILYFSENQVLFLSFTGYSKKVSVFDQFITTKSFDQFSKFLLFWIKRNLDSEIKIVEIR